MCQEPVEIQLNSRRWFSVFRNTQEVVWVLHNTCIEGVDSVIGRLIGALTRPNRITTPWQTRITTNVVFLTFPVLITDGAPLAGAHNGTFPRKKKVYMCPAI